MNRRFWVVLLLLAFLLGSGSGFWSKPAWANSEEERKVCVCAAWPWNEGDWNTVTPPPTSNQNSTYSTANSARLGDKVEPQRVQQKPQQSFWSRIGHFLFNLKLPFGDK